MTGNSYTENDGLGSLLLRHCPSKFVHYQFKIKDIL